MFDRIILVDKPSGMTSFGVVARVRRVLSEQAGRKVKVGHTGTLDPFATGLMILLTGKRCKEAEGFSKLDKVYEAEFVVGKVSSTGDPEGEISEVSTVQPLASEVEGICRQFVGDIYQTPPIYSAIKIGGERAYKLARKGEKPVIPKRKVTIYSLDVLEYDYPSLKIRVHVSSGTYIRTLAEDIGRVLRAGAYCKELKRVQVGPYLLDEADALGKLGITD